jgi:hypothetical protein
VVGSGTTSGTPNESTEEKVIVFPNPSVPLMVWRLCTFAHPLLVTLRVSKLNPGFSTELSPIDAHEKLNVNCEEYLFPAGLNPTET